MKTYTQRLQEYGTWHQVWVLVLLAGMQVLLPVEWTPARFIFFAVAFFLWDAVRAWLAERADQFNCRTCNGKAWLPAATHPFRVPCPDCNGGVR